MFEIKGKTVLATSKKVSGKIEGLRAPFSFRGLKRSLKGKILVCPGNVSKDVLEKARALDVFGIVCQSIDEREIERIKKELKTSWSPSLFALLVVDENIELDKIEGKMATIEVEKKKLIIDVEGSTLK